MLLLRFIIILFLIFYSVITQATSEIINNQNLQNQNLWPAIRQEFKLFHYEDNPEVQLRIHWFYQHPDYLLRAMQRATPWLYFIAQEAKKRHLPAELVLLPIIESAYNPLAKNEGSGATGLWQMQMRTAADYGVKKNWWYDGRRDVISSTKAALDHLTWLNNFFHGNWLLAIAAYDTGQGNVLSAISHNKKNNAPTDFWSLPLAKETRDYVPRLLALAAIIAHPEKYPVEFPNIPNAPYLAEINTGSQLDLKQAAALAKLSIKKIRQLNPGYTYSATGPSGPFKIVLPIKNIEFFTKNFTKITHFPRLHWRRYEVQPGDNLASIAEHFSLTPEMIRQHNPIIGEKLTPGTNLLIAEATQPEFTEITTENNLSPKQPTISSLQPVKNYSLQPGDTLYMVRADDDLTKIANHFKLAITDILASNHSITHNPPIGQVLIIPTHIKTQLDPPQFVANDIIYVVKHHETLEEIAATFHTTPARIRIANLMMNSKVTPGDRLLIPASV